MNWIMELLDVYDKNREKAGVMDTGSNVLLPLYHTTVKAQITVTIDGDGNFLRAETVSKGDESTIIPVTDGSASRTSTTVAPHPLCDSLKYLAGDYSVYVMEKDYSENYVKYIEQLKKWVDSPYSHPKVEAVYRYLQKAELMKDLYEQKNIFQLDEAGNIFLEAKIEGELQTKAFVRFRIETGEMLPEDALKDETGSLLPECWRDRSLQSRYVEYCNAKQDRLEMSYLTGEREKISYLQPKGIRFNGDKAKLISSNANGNYDFTFRGRFCDKEEAFAIGYEDSQKVHTALKWIIRKQGTNYGELYFVTWRSDLKELPNWQDNSEEQCKTVEVLANMDEPGAENPLYDSWQNGGSVDDWFEDEPVYAGVSEAEAARFRKAMHGYQKKLDMDSHTMIMAFDAATQGRLAMMEAKEYETSRYLEGLQNWYRRCEWIQPVYSKEKGRYTYIGMVGIKEAAELLYGTEKKGCFSMSGKEERYKDVAKRWMPCILDNREVPVDMVRLAVQRASSPVSFESRFLWERILGLACSLVKQQYERRYGEVWTMALNENSRDRNYLYGRMLALADRVEYRTYEKGEERQTNAKRYMCAFSQHPFRTWKVLEEKMGPYLMQLNVPERLKYQTILDEIYELFSEEDFAKDEALSGLYLLGFHNQAYAFKNHKKEEEE